MVGVQGTTDAKGRRLYNFIKNCKSLFTAPPPPLLVFGRQKGAMLRLVEFELDSTTVLTAPEFIDLEATFTKLNRESMTLGRGSSEKNPVDVVLALKHCGREVISRNHLRIGRSETKSGIKYTVTDLGALNGVFVNSFKIDSAELQDRDELQVGGVSGIKVGEKQTDSDVSIKYVFEAATPLSFAKKRPLASTDSLHNQRNSKSSKGGDELETMKQLISKQEREIGELRAHVRTMKTTVTQKTKEVDKLNALLFKSDHLVSKRSESIALLQRQIDELTRKESMKPKGFEMKQLKQRLNCPLCNDLLLDAVVMRCSHAYCRCCIETHLRKENVLCTCPLCNNKPPVKGKETAPSLYVRSLHLDELVTFVVESSNKQTQDAFTARDKKFRHQLKTLGLNADFNDAEPNQHDDSDRANHVNSEEGAEEEEGIDEDIECSQDV